MKTRIYAASKTWHYGYWQALRASGVNIISTWIDEAGPGETKDPAELAQRCLAEVSTCDLLILYITSPDEPKGAFIEMGAALALGKKIKIVAPTYRIGIFKFHPLVEQFRCMSEALETVPDYAFASPDSRLP